MFVTLAGILAIVGALAGGLLFRDAAGDVADRGRPRQQRRPQGGAGADPGLRPDAQPCPAAPDADRRRRRERPGARRRQGRSRHHPRRSRRAEKRAGRGDAAQERRGAVGAPDRQGQGQEGRPEDHQDRAARRAPHRRGRPHPGQRQSAQGDPAAIRRRSRQGRDRAVSGQRGRGGHPQPEGGRLSRRRSGQQQDHRGCDRGIDTRRRRADLPRDRFGRGDRAEPSRSTRPPKFPPAPSAARPTGPTTRSRPSASRTTSSRAKACRNRRLPPSPGSCSRSGSN